MVGFLFFLGCGLDLQRGTLMPSVGGVHPIMVGRDPLAFQTNRFRHTAVVGF